MARQQQVRTGQGLCFYRDQTKGGEKATACMDGNGGGH
jgi:hypothetical protein